MISPPPSPLSDLSVLPSPIRGIDQVWVINLDRRPDRLDSFRRHHPELEGCANRLSAYDGKSLKLTPALARLFAPNNFDWHKPTMGCALSHLELWLRVANESDDNASYLILEDDARMSRGWIPAIEHAFESKDIPTDWQILYLGGILPQYRNSFDQNIEIVRGAIARVRKDCVFGKNPTGYFHFCAYAYILNKRGAQRILNLLKSWNGYWLQADFVAAYTTPDLTPARPIYFFHPLIAESFQDTGAGFARPYDEGQGNSVKVDSDIWKNSDRFSTHELSDFPTTNLPLDIPAALGTTRVEPTIASIEAESLQPESFLGATDAQEKNEKLLPPRIKSVDKIWVINLERRKDRLERFFANNPDIAGQASVLKAYDGKKLALTPRIARLFAPNDFNWNKATIGCSLSHLELWHRLANEPEENARYLILEDDSKLTPGWLRVIDDAFDAGDVPSDWDVLYLGGVLPKNEHLFFRCKEQISGHISCIAPNVFFGQKPPNRYFHFGAFAYILSKKGAVNLLEFIRLRQGVWPQADILLGYVTPDSYPLRLKHYFFDPLLAQCYQDAEDGFVKSYSEDQMAGKLDSDIWKEDANFDELVAKAMISTSEQYDIAGALEDARHEITCFVESNPPRISLLHATRGRPQQAIEARRIWIERAENPKRIEHIFAIDHDDESSECLKEFPHVIQNNEGFSVGAWNLAAKNSTGDILIQLSDDWDPPTGWDLLISERLDISRELVLWVNDGNRKDDLLCMAILTRKYYESSGLFDSRFKNVFSDDDFTIRAKKAGKIKDARDITIIHKHPTAGRSDVDETYFRGNSPDEYKRAKQLFDEIRRKDTVYSQNDEQIVIENYFGNFSGILWDFGCNDGVTLSNSHHLLMNKGWSGVLVDASKTCIDKASRIYRDRPDIQLLNIGLTDRNGEFEFFESGSHLTDRDSALLSSFNKDHVKNWETRAVFQKKSVRCYNFKTFYDWLTKYKKADFISIDVEGFDFEILSSIDLGRTETKLVCVEHNNVESHKYINYCNQFGFSVISRNAENLIMAR